MIRHLLVAHDLTPEADVALARAAQLARQHDARVSLLHVYDPGPSMSAVKTVSAMLQLKRKGGRPRRGQRHPPVQGPADRRHPAADPGARTGPAADGRTPPEDLRTLRQHHPRPGGARSRVPVLLAVREADEPYRQALSALDFPQCACTALRQAYRLLPVEADLHALHVFESSDDGVLGLPRQNAAHLATQAGLIEQLAERRAGAPAGRRAAAEPRSGSRRAAGQPDAALKQRQPELLALGRQQPQRADAGAASATWRNVTCASRAVTSWLPRRSAAAEAAQLSSSPCNSTNCWVNLCRGSRKISGVQAWCDSRIFTELIRYTGSTGSSSATSSSSSCCAQAGARLELVDHDALDLQVFVVVVAQFLDLLEKAISAWREKLSQSKGIRQRSAAISADTV